MQGFACIGKGEKPLTDDILQKAGVTAFCAYNKASAMARAAEIISQENDDCLCKVPFSNTIEAQQWGSQISISSIDNSVFISNSASDKLETLNCLREWNLKSGPVREVLLAVRELAEADKNPVLNLNGPFSVLSMLTSASELYRALKRQPELVKNLCTVIIEQLVSYAREAVKNGAVIISYADSVIVPGLISPKLCSEICAPITLQAIKNIAAAVKNTTVHVCSRTMGIIRDMPLYQIIEADAAGMKYGEAVLQIPGPTEEKRIVVNGCLQQSGRRMERGVIRFMQY